ncbi:MAG: homocysteine S-methyltransferase [Clostridiales bacterium]|nr:homocysteine S-methyltransferase [Clostridiales bacterium]
MKTCFDTVKKAKDLIILDGAMATELEKKGLDLNDELWSAKVLAEQAEYIKQVHYDYFSHGADCSISASYQATIPGYEKKGYTKEQASALIAKSMELLLSAREEWWENEGKAQGRTFPLAAASIGPYGAYLADGSEYTGNYQVSTEFLRDFHYERIQILKAAGAEIIAIETFPCLMEAKVCAEIMEELGCDYYISFSFQNESFTNGGDTIPACVEALKAGKHIKAIGLNCTKPEYVTQIIKNFKACTLLPIIVYPNSGETYDATDKVWHGSANQKTYGGWSKEWYEAGARIIGGCCRTSPNDIAQIYKWYEEKKSQEGKK